MTTDPHARKIGLILGSASPRRSALLRQIGAAFEIRIPNSDETIKDITQPGEYVSELSLRKASAVSLMVKDDLSAHVKYNRLIIIGADTIVVTREGEILGKPVDSNDAKHMLKTLSGEWHEVYTGVTLIDMSATQDGIEEADFINGVTPNKPLVKYETTRVKICEMDDVTIDYYISTGEPYGKAGAYAIQGAGSMFIERVEGCYYNVVGLPLGLLRSMLYTFGYDLLKKKSLG